MAFVLWSTRAVGATFHRSGFVPSGSFPGPHTCELSRHGAPRRTAGTRNTPQVTHLRPNFRPNSTKQAITGRDGGCARGCRSAVFIDTSATRHNRTGRPILNYLYGG